MNKCLLSLIFLPIILFASAKTELPAQVEKCTELLLLQNYAEAEKVVKQSNLPKIDSLFLTVLTENAKLADYESYALNGRKFLILCDSARTALQKTEEYKRPKLHHYYLGTIEGAAAVVRAKKNDYAGALTAGNVSKKFLDKAAEDSLFTPALFGVGMRRWYSAAVSTRIGLGKERLASAIALMEKAAGEENAVSRAFMPSLFWVYMDGKMYGKAEKCAKQFLEQYPQNTVMLRGLVKLQRMQKNYDEARKNAELLMSISEKRTPVNWSDYYSGGTAVVSIMMETSRFREACAEAERLLAVKNDSKTLQLEWVKKHRRRLQELQVQAKAKS